MKFAANCISAARIFLALGLFFVQPLGLWFFVIYFCCGLSDILDGYIARKTHTTSKLGAKLDSIGDLVMVAVLTVVLYPVLNPTIQQILWIIFIVIVRVISMSVVFLKFRTFAILHTYANKLTGLLLFVFIPLLVFVESDLLIVIVCLVGSLSAVEELLINLSSKELNLNRKGLFSK